MSEYRTRTRPVVAELPASHYSIGSNDYVYNHVFTGGETMVDRTNPAHWLLLRLKREGKLRGWVPDTGSNMTKTCAMSSHSPALFTGSRYGIYRYNGVRLFPRYSGRTLPTMLMPNSLDLVPYGTKAIANCAPTVPHASTLQTVAELYKDGLPRATGISMARCRSVLDAFKRGGDEYLNVEFGWKPLLSDVGKILESLRKIDEILYEYDRQSGQLVRRRFSFPTSTESAVTNEGSYYPTPAYSGLLTGQGTRFLTVQTTDDIWFSGQFTYYSHLLGSMRSRIYNEYMKANHAFGIALDPATLWNLAPWTWAIDWFANVGDALQNISMFLNDGLIMRYGYVMRTTVRRETHDLMNFRYFTGASSSCSQEFVYETKSRCKAIPFGFGLTSSALTARQWAILAALGITHGADKLDP